LCEATGIEGEEKDEQCEDTDEHILRLFNQR
jgi:hypothetical protein